MSALAKKNNASAHAKNRKLVASVFNKDNIIDENATSKDFVSTIKLKQN